MSSTTNMYARDMIISNTYIGIRFFIDSPYNQSFPKDLSFSEVGCAERGAHIPHAFFHGGGGIAHYAPHNKKWLCPINTAFGTIINVLSGMFWPQRVPF